MNKKVEKQEELGSNIVPEEALAEGEGLEAHPLDHDADGEKGGSLAGEESTVAKGRKKKAGRHKKDHTWIILEENDDIPPTGLPISHNGRPFLIMPGEPVEVPNYLVDILDHAIQSGPVINPQTRQVMGYRDRMRFPYRRIEAPENPE